MRVLNDERHVSVCLCVLFFFFAFYCADNNNGNNLRQKKREEKKHTSNSTRDELNYLVEANTRCQRTTTMKKNEKEEEEEKTSRRQHTNQKESSKQFLQCANASPLRECRNVFSSLFRFFKLIRVYVSSVAPSR